MEGMGITVTEHLLLHQKENPMATGQFTRLLKELIFAAKIISREVNQAGLVDILGMTGKINVQGEEVKKLDEFANRVLIHRMSRAGMLAGMASEENADIIKISEEMPSGDYILVFDPLDGSSNIDVNVNIGTIFSIHRKKSSRDDISLNDFLRKGSEQVAAGYFLYGPSTMLIYSAGDGVNGFTLDPGVGEFLLSHPHIKIPESGKCYSVNESYTKYWPENTKKVVEYFKNSYNADGKSYSARYIGSLVADFHRNLFYGGIFMYPADTKDPAKPNGKLRLLCEAAPLAYLAEQAGGLATDGRDRILDITAEQLHQRVPLFIGSRKDVEKAMAILHS